MANIFSKIFGSDNVIDAGIKAGDAVWFTNEEKSEWVLRLLKAYEPFKIAQRLLMMTFCLPYAFLATLMFLGSLTLGWDIMGHLKLLNETFGQPCSIILAFYFGGGLLEGAIRAGKEK